MPGEGSSSLFTAFYRYGAPPQLGQEVQHIGSGRSLPTSLLQGTLGLGATGFRVQVYALLQCSRPFFRASMHNHSILVALVLLDDIAPPMLKSLTWGVALGLGKV